MMVKKTNKQVFNDAGDLMDFDDDGDFEPFHVFLKINDKSMKLNGPWCRHIGICTQEIRHFCHSYGGFWNFWIPKTMGFNTNMANFGMIWVLNGDFHKNEGFLSHGGTPKSSNWFSNCRPETNQLLGILSLGRRMVSTCITEFMVINTDTNG